jgi:hypothetical protein
MHAIHKHYKLCAPWMLLRSLSTFADPTFSITVILYSRKNGNRRYMLLPRPAHPSDIFRMNAG